MLKYCLKLILNKVLMSKAKKTMCVNYKLCKPVISSYIDAPGIMVGLYPDKLKNTISQKYI